MGKLSLVCLFCVLLLVGSILCKSKKSVKPKILSQKPNKESPGWTQQLHLALTGNPHEMKAMWATNSSITESICEYGFSTGNYSQRVSGKTYTYTDGGFDGLVHLSVMNNLNLGTTYYYRCGSPANWTHEYSFRTQSGNADTKTVVGMIGDEGIHLSGWTMELMNQDAENRLYDLVINIGDISYADDYSTPNSWVVEEYLNRVEPLTATAPMMTSPGNHEHQFQYAVYLNRFPMINSTNSSFWYSFDFNSVHWLSFSTGRTFSLSQNKN